MGEVCGLQVEYSVKYQHTPSAIGLNGFRMTTVANAVQTSLSEKKKIPSHEVEPAEGCRQLHTRILMQALAAHVGETAGRWPIPLSWKSWAPFCPGRKRRGGRLSP